MCLLTYLLFWTQAAYCLVARLLRLATTVGGVWQPGKDDWQPIAVDSAEMCRREYFKRL